MMMAVFMENSKENIQHEHSGGCQNLLHKLSDYIDGQLSIELCAEIEAHLKTCKNCTIVVDTLKRTIDLYQETTKTEKMPDDVRQRLYKHLNLQDFILDSPTPPKIDE